MITAVFLTLLAAGTPEAPAPVAPVAPAQHHVRHYGAGHKPARITLRQVEEALLAVEEARQKVAASTPDLSGELRAARREIEQALEGLDVELTPDGDLERLRLQLQRDGEATAALLAAEQAVALDEINARLAAMQTALEALLEQLPNK